MTRTWRVVYVYVDILTLFVYVYVDAQGLRGQPTCLGPYFSSPCQLCRQLIPAVGRVTKRGSEYRLQAGKTSPICVNAVLRMVLFDPAKAGTA